MGYRLSDASLLCQRTVPVPTRYRSRVYGTCSSGEDTGCAPPLEIQNWPECARDYASYSRPVTHRTLSLSSSRRLAGQAIPAALIASTQIELYEGTMTVVVFADRPSLARRAARALARRIVRYAARRTFRARRRAALRAPDCTDA
ncbi:MAG: hypothetical protein QOI62_3335 [Solirubrobacteraceae bacterium]|jgi:hypothetical protein|nr:hypothetical protein [Solirubrobacteraceae bacterium]